MPRQMPLALAITTLVSLCGGCAQSRPVADCADWNSREYFEIATAADVAACLESGVDPRARTDGAQTPLHMAAGFSRSPAVIALLLRNGAGVRVRDGGGLTPLHFAAWSNENPAITAALIDAGADIFAGAGPRQGLVKELKRSRMSRRESANVMTRDKHSITPLTPIHAEAWPDSDLIYVIASLMDPDQYSGSQDDGMSALQFAAVFNENPEVTNALLKAGADARGAFGGGKLVVSPLFLAAAYNSNPAIVTTLLEAGANPIAGGTPDGETSLHAATTNANPAILFKLLDAGADPNARDDGGVTPLHRAASNKNLDIVEALLDAGADPKAKARNRIDNTPLHRAATSENPDIVAALLDAGANPKARDILGATPLHRAVTNENLAVVRAILDAGADPKARTKTGGAPLHSVRYNSKPAVVAMLVDAGADVNARDSLGFTPLHSVLLSSLPLGELGFVPLRDAKMQAKNLAVIAALLNAGANSNARPRGVGWTPLQFAAARHEDPSIINLLLDAGADPNVQDADGKTPWDYAKDNEALNGTDAYWRLHDARF